MTSLLREPAPDRLDVTSARLEQQGAVAALEWAFEEFGPRVALGTGFGLEGAALLDMAVRIEPKPVVFFVDTGFLFPETYELRRRLEARYEIEIQAVEPALTPQQQEDVFGARLWAFDPDFCCSMRKVEPLDDFLVSYAAWITAVRRTQTANRAAAQVLEWDDRRGVVKVNPLVAWSREEVWRYVRANDVPYNPLLERGYPSIGCTHCTRRVNAGEHERAGRWAEFGKTECGLHLRREA
jgi:phosphoadenosine phosphosulfate reductase